MIFAMVSSRGASTGTSSDAVETEYTIFGVSLSDIDQSTRPSVVFILADDLGEA